MVHPLESDRDAKHAATDQHDLTRGILDLDDMIESIGRCGLERAKAPPFHLVDVTMQGRISPTPPSRDKFLHTT